MYGSGLHITLDIPSSVWTFVLHANIALLVIHELLVCMHC